MPKYNFKYQHTYYNIDILYTYLIVRGNTMILKITIYIIICYLINIFTLGIGKKYRLAILFLFGAMFGYFVV